MPTNITKGNAAKFVVQFLDSQGVTTIPAGGTVSITYVSGLTTSSTDLSLTQQDSFFTATWSTSVADFGSAPWYVTSLGSTTIVKSGEIRIIDQS